MLFDIERELFLLQLSGEKSVLASLSHHPGYRQITGIPCLDFLKQVHVLLTCYVVLDVINERLFDSLALKLTNLRQGYHG